MKKYKYQEVKLEYINKLNMNIKLKWFLNF